MTTTRGEAIGGLLDMLAASRAEVDTLRNTLIGIELLSHPDIVRHEGSTPEGRLDAIHTLTVRAGGTP